MSVRDVIKNSVYESFGGGTGLSTVNILIILAVACLVGLYIFMIYKLSSKAAFYSKDLNMTLAGMTLVVAAIMIAMQSNLIVSLGMVGALSIVRFRNAVKNPMDLLYLFWAVSAGIICGVGLYILAIILCAAMTVMLLVLEAIPACKASSLLVVRGPSDQINCEHINNLVNKYCKYAKEKSRSIKNNETELIIEVKTKAQEELLKELSREKNLTQIHFLSHDGESRM